MQFSAVNGVKIYNLSAGKSVPEWLSERKRRKLNHKDIDVRRRIQLIQDFDMPDLSDNITLSPDGRYIFATGSYKPCIKCYDIDNLSLKFSRGLDSDAIKVIILSKDFKKFIILEEERYLEFHAAFGRYFRMRVPKFGRDMAFCSESSDLYIVGNSSEIFRLNLEMGRFLEPLRTSSSSLNRCEFNSHHSLFLCGTVDGRIEAWDPRDVNKAATLDCVAYALAQDAEISTPEISCIKFSGALKMGVGTSTGRVLLYDIRSSKPFLVKDLRTDLPVKNIDFVPHQNLVLSMDNRILKIWEEKNGKPFAAIEPGTILTDFCRYPDSGLMFMANDAPKMLQFFVPSIGLAPKWCSYLESITEELEETEQPAVYDDYKFISKNELESIGLSHLIGTNILRPYMHGYFIDVRLYNKAVILMQPFAYENCKKQKLLEQLDSERHNLSLLKNSNEWEPPKINKELAAKLHAEIIVEDKKFNRKIRRKKENASSLLEDERFKQMFSNPDFQIDETSEQFQLINPALKKLEAKRNKSKFKLRENEILKDKTDDIPGSNLLSNEEIHASCSSSESDLDEKDNGNNESNENHLEDFVIPIETQTEGDHVEESQGKTKIRKKPRGFKLFELETGEDASQFLLSTASGENIETLGSLRERLNGTSLVEDNISFGGCQMSYRLQSRGGIAANIRRIAEKQEEHLKERRQLRRETREITKTLKRLPVRGSFSSRGGRDV